MTHTSLDISVFCVCWFKLKVLKYKVPGYGKKHIQNADSNLFPAAKTWWKYCNYFIRAMWLQSEVIRKAFLKDSSRLFWYFI